MFILDLCIDVLTIVLFKWVDIPENCKLDSAFCNRVQRAYLFEIYQTKSAKASFFSIKFRPRGHSIFSLDWIIKRKFKIEHLLLDHRLLEVLNNVNIPSPDAHVAFEATTRLDFVKMMYYYDEGKLDGIDRLTELISCCSSLKTLYFNFRREFVMNNILRKISTDVLKGLTSLDLHCDKDGKIGKDSVDLLTRHCSVLCKLSLNSCKECSSEDFLDIISNNKKTLQCLKLAQCMNVNVDFFAFLSETLFENITELCLVDCHVGVKNSAATVFDVNNPIPKLLECCKCLCKLAVSYCFATEWNAIDTRGFYYDIENSEHRLLVLIGMKDSFLYDMLCKEYQCTFSELHEVIFHQMNEMTCTIASKITCTNNSPTLRSCSFVACDGAFTKDMIKNQFVQCESMRAMRIWSCEHLSAEDVQDIFDPLCGIYNNLEVISIVGQPVKFMHLLNIVQQSSELKALIVERCHPTLIGQSHRENHQAEMEIVESLLQKKRPGLSVGFLDSGYFTFFNGNLWIK